MQWLKRARTGPSPPSAFPGMASPLIRTDSSLGQPFPKDPPRTLRWYAGRVHDGCERMLRRARRNRARAIAGSPPATWNCTVTSPGAGLCDNDASGGEAPFAATPAPAMIPATDGVLAHEASSPLLGAGGRNASESFAGNSRCEVRYRRFWRRWGQDPYLHPVMGRHVAAHLLDGQRKKIRRAADETGAPDGVFDLVLVGSGLAEITAATRRRGMRRAEVRVGWKLCRCVRHRASRGL